MGIVIFAGIFIICLKMLVFYYIDHWQELKDRVLAKDRKSREVKLPKHIQRMK